MARRAPVRALAPSPEQASLEQTARLLWRTGTANPFALIRAGILELESPYHVTKDGIVVEEGRVAGRLNYHPMYPNPLQARVLNLIEGLQRRGLSCSIIGLKPRRGAFSTICQAVMFVRALFISPSLNFVVAHRQDVAQDLLQKAHTFYDRASWLHPWVAKVPDRLDAIGFESRPTNAPGDRDFVVHASFIHAITADKKGIDALRGKGAAMIQLSERDFYTAEAELSKALTAVIEGNAGSILIEESTAQGKIGSSFADRFLEAWALQGMRNFDDPRGGYQFGRHFNTAIFFGMHEDPRNVCDLQPGVPWEHFEGRLDEYERRVLAETIYPYHIHRLLDQHAARIASLRNLAYRRCRLATVYKDETVLPRFKPYDGGISEFVIDYPFTPQDALSGAQQRTALRKDQRDWLASRSRPPIWKGDIYPVAGERRRFRMREDSGGQVWLWKDPEECPGRVIFALDPGYKEEIDPGTFNTDPSFGVAYDWDSGEVFLSFQSFDGPVTVAERVHAILLFLASVRREKGEREVEEKRLPLFGEEAVITAFVTETLVNGDRFCYPEHRIFRHPKLNAAGEVTWSNRLGVYTSNAVKLSGVQVMRRWIDNAIAAEQGGPTGGTSKLCIYDERILAQFEWFVEKDTPGGGSTYQAEDKHGKSERRYDDGPVACLMACVMANQLMTAGQPAPGVIAKSTGGPEDIMRSLQFDRHGHLSREQAEEYEDHLFGITPDGADPPPRRIYDWTDPKCPARHASFAGE